MRFSQILIGELPALKPVDVSVLLVTHNHENFIRDALDSIDAQKTDLAVEVVVADDASDDSTTSIIEEWASRTRFSVRILPPAARLGITGNYSRGFSACNGRFIAVLEGDDEWLSVEKIQLQVDELDSNPGLAMVSTRLLRHNELTGESSVFPSIATDGSRSEFTSAQLADYNWIGTFSSCMYRTEALRRISPEVFETTAYDWLVNMAITEFGNAGFLPQVMTLYRIHPSGHWSSAQQMTRDNQLRAVIPKYIELLGSRVAPELSRELRAVDRRLSSMNEESPSEGAQESHHRRALHTPSVPRVTTAKAPVASIVMASGDNDVGAMASIRSVLEQTIEDLELVVIDDSSNDRLATMIATISDPRLRVYRFMWPEGIGASLSLAIQQTRAAFIGIIDPGNTWFSSALETQLKPLLMDSRLGGVITGELAIAPGESYGTQPGGETRASLLRRLFEREAPGLSGALIRREVFDRVGLPDNGFGALSHLGALIALVKDSPVMFIDDKRLVDLAGKGKGGGYHDHDGEYRDRLLINEKFFDGCSIELVLEAFRGLFVDPFASSQEEVECEIALLYINTRGELRQINQTEGLRRLRRLLEAPKTALILRSRYRVTDATLRELAIQTRLSRIATTDFAANSSAQLLSIVVGRVRSWPRTAWPGRLRRLLGRRA